MVEDKNRGEVEINLLELAKKLWNNKKFIAKCSIIGVVVGLVVAFSLPKEYTTTVVLLPEVQSTMGGTMGSLASLAGINLGRSVSDALASPDLYPDIFKSTLFLKGLLEIKVESTEESVNTTLYSYLNDYKKVAWWTYPFVALQELMGSFSTQEEEEKQNERVYSKEELRTLTNLYNRISVTSNKRTGITSIEVTMQDPEISAFLADSLASYFQCYIINYRTQKARTDLKYAEKLYDDSKSEYYRMQQKLATFEDGNKNIISAKYRTNLVMLQNEVNIVYSVYTQTAQQLELAKVKVQDNTPVFTLIQPAIQPLYPNTSKKKVLVGFVFLSLILSGCWILKDDLKKIILHN